MSSHSFGAAVGLFATLLAFVDIMRAVDEEDDEGVRIVGEKTALARPKMRPLRRRIDRGLSWLMIFPQK